MIGCQCYTFWHPKEFKVQNLLSLSHALILSTLKFFRATRLMGRDVSFVTLSRMRSHINTIYRTFYSPNPRKIPSMTTTQSKCSACYPWRVTLPTRIFLLHVLEESISLFKSRQQALILQSLFCTRFGFNNTRACLLSQFSLLAYAFEKALVPLHLQPL